MGYEPGSAAGLDATSSRLTESIRDCSASVAAVAAQFADEVDRDARFPEEAIGAAQATGLLGMMIPTAFGGRNAPLHDVVDICYRLARSCSSTAMIFAMHQSCVACIVRHGQESHWHRAWLQQIASEQMLLASSTTEGSGGGDVRSSHAAVDHASSVIHLERAATVLSYGARADGILTTARRKADGAASDQVLVAFGRSDYSLTPSLSWNSLGMRGTCSGGFGLHATGSPDQVFPQPYERIHAMTMVPVHHLLWSGVWTGIAAGAVDRAQSFVRRAARKGDGTLPPGAAQLTQARSTLLQLRSLVTSSLRTFEAHADNERWLRSITFQSMINLTKVDASELAVATVLSAARACGLSGYRNDSEFSIGRQLRDVLSAPIMIHNDRILSNLVSASAIGAVPEGLLE